MNQLKAWMDFYDQSGAGGPRDGGMGMNAANYNGARLSFAQRMLQDQQGQGRPGPMPNYFNSQDTLPQQPYVPPTAVAPNPRFPMINGGPPPPAQPYTGGINYLKELLGFGPPQRSIVFGPGGVRG